MKAVVNRCKDNKLFLNLLEFNIKKILKNQLFNRL